MTILGNIINTETAVGIGLGYVWTIKMMMPAVIQKTTVYGLELVTAMINTYAAAMSE